ncbi:MAG: FAD:protein FMN transferase [Elusimicrobia bacterium]|nr:FAD:protein FMN transferase [Elusimicrobiota bacterium]
MSRNIRKFLPVILLLVIALVYVFRKYIADEPIRSQTRFLLDTYCTIQVPGGGEALKYADTAFDRMIEIGSKFNIHDPSSCVYRFNREGAPINDPEVTDIIKDSLEVYDKSGGSFDITVFPLLDLWGFYDKTPKVPDMEDIKRALKNTGRGKLLFDRNTLEKKDPGVMIDLGGIAKGYAVREAARILKLRGVTAALIDAGGDIYAMGSPKNRLWKIGIRSPREEGILGILELSDTAVVTSGDYERFFFEDGIRYHHIIDPRTGYPARGLISVTVVHHDPVMADAWATAFFIMGKEKILEFLKTRPEFRVILVDEDGSIYYSQTLESCLKPENAEKCHAIR